MPDIADSVKQMDTITYCFAPGCQNVFLENLEPRLLPNKSAEFVCPPHPIQGIAATPSRRTTGNGYVNKVGSALFSVIAKTMITRNGSTKDLKNG